MEAPASQRKIFPPLGVFALQHGSVFHVEHRWLGARLVLHCNITLC